MRKLERIHEPGAIVAFLKSEFYGGSRTVVEQRMRSVEISPAAILDSK